MIYRTHAHGCLHRLLRTLYVDWVGQS